MIAKWDGKCRKCGVSYKAGESIRYSNLTKQTFCVGCWGTKTETATVREGALQDRIAAIQAARVEQATEPVPAESPENGLGQAQPAPLPAESPAPSDAYLAPLAAALAVHMKLPAAQSYISETAVAEIAARVVAEYHANLEQPAPTVIEVRQPERPAVSISGAHYLMPRLLRLLGAGMHLYLWGPAGSGKTTAAMQAAHALSRVSEIDTLDPSTFRSMVQGYMTPTGEPVHTVFTRCWTDGQVYIGDECDNAPGHVQTLFNSALANGHAPLAWGNVARKDSFAFIGTGNTPGRPTSEFPDRRPMSAAFKDRLYFMHWPLDNAIECRAAGLPVPRRDARAETTCTPAEWGGYVQRTREWASKNAPTLMVTPRATLDGLRALAIGETPAEVADALIFRGADSEMVRKALNAVSLPGA